MIDSEGSKSGYGYEVIRMMSKYLDVDFEYIGYENGWEDMADYAKEKGFSYTPVYFELHNDMEKALQKGDVDALLTSSLRKTEEERIYYMQDGQSIGIVHQTPTPGMTQVSCLLRR